MRKRIKTLAGGLLVSVLGLIACSTVPTQQTTSQAESPAANEPNAQAIQSPSQQNACTLVESGFGPAGRVNVRVEEVVSGLDVPWGIAFLPGGEMLVTERSGNVRLVQNGTLQPQPIATVSALDQGEGGLLGIAAHPDVATNRQFYLYFTTTKNGTSVNRVERWQLAQDRRSATRDRIIIDDIPVAQFHNGGRIRFGPDGMLYIGTGDARLPDISQDINNLGGKILRLTPEGQVPEDNPIAGNPVYISGIRNTQGFDWANSSTLLVSDHGPSGELGRRGHDKVSVARAGDNLGWPTIYRCETQAGLVTPTIVWREAMPPGGATVYTGNAIPEWKGSFILAGLRSELLQRVEFDPQLQRVQRYESYLQGQHGRLREAIMGPDGELYVTTSNCDGRGACPASGDKILRITR